MVHLNMTLQSQESKVSTKFLVHSKKKIKTLNILDFRLQVLTVHGFLPYVRTASLNFFLTKTAKLYIVIQKKLKDCNKKKKLKDLNFKIKNILEKERRKSRRACKLGLCLAKDRQKI